MTTKNLLVELLVEELPPKSLRQLGDSFAQLLFASLAEQDLVAENEYMKAYASPRRLAVYIANVDAQAADKSISRKLMPVKVGLDEHGEPTPPLLKKLASLGTDASAIPHLMRVMDGKSEVLFLDTVVKGTMLLEGLQKALDEAIDQLPIPKVMTYQLTDGWQTVNFARPVHGLVALHGTGIMPVSVLGLTAGRETQGHRFEASSHPVVLKDADSYVQQLEEEGAVIPGFDERRAEIERQLAAVTAQGNLTPIKDVQLLDEVTALVEHPNVLVGKFEAEFLDVPQECLILTMKANQKYFPMLDEHGELANKFVMVSNIQPVDTSLVVGGNERVVRSRLADAKFFFDQDRKKALVSRVPGLDKVVYHNKLGMQGLRVFYVRAIARWIGQELGDQALAAQAEEAAILAKADLLTDMVGEFPELQGIMGRYYAQYEGYSDAIAFAIEDHYKPRFAGDELPRGPVGTCVALADKLETLVSMFSIGQTPTGDKDPFALRRHALGVIRMIIEKDLPIEIDKLIKRVIEIIQDENIPKEWVNQRQNENLTYNPRQVSTEASEQLLVFIYERLAGNLREQGYSTQEVEAVLSLQPQNLSDIFKRLVAVRDFTTMPEAESLASANKRVGNILKKSEGQIRDKVDTALLQAPAEQELYQTLTEILPRTDDAFKISDYTTCLQILAALKLPVDTFFDHVMVNTEDEALRANRLALLGQLQKAMNRVADISRLAA